MDVEQFFAYININATMTLDNSGVMLPNLNPEMSRTEQPHS